MAICTIINFLGMRWRADTNSTFTWWKIFVPVLLIIVFASTHFRGSNFGSHGGFAPYGAKGVFAAVSTAGVAFALLGFEQADQLAGESRNPQRDIPRAIIGAMILGALIYVLLQVVFIGALPASALTPACAPLPFKLHPGPFPRLSTLIRLR